MVTTQSEIIACNIFFAIILVIIDLYREIHIYNAIKLFSEMREGWYVKLTDRPVA